MVGKFLHGEEKFATSLSKSQKPERVRSVCDTLGKVCPAWPPLELQVKSAADKCGACQGVVLDAVYLLRRSRLSELAASALKKKKLEVFELMENLCLDTYTRWDDEPTVRFDVCTHMWEEDEDEVIDATVKHSEDEKRAAHALCVERFALCKPEQVQVSKVHQEL